MRDLQDIQADAAESANAEMKIRSNVSQYSNIIKLKNKIGQRSPVDIGVVQLSQETNFWGTHGILSRQKQLQAEESTLVRRIDGTGDSNIEVANVVLIRCRVNSFNGFREQPLRFL